MLSPILVGGIAQSYRCHSTMTGELMLSASRFIEATRDSVA